ncbi:MAG TPA: hypothetical protein PLD54_02105 [Candidatus Levybacteria bacterium]|nr:hypothetical protein [Candidatus Levybacteria bacterium]
MSEVGEGDNISYIEEERKKRENANLVNQPQKDKWGIIGKFADGIVRILPKDPNLENRQISPENIGTPNTTQPEPNPESSSPPDNITKFPNR